MEAALMRGQLLLLMVKNHVSINILNPMHFLIRHILLQSFVHTVSVCIIIICTVSQPVH